MPDPDRQELVAVDGLEQHDRLLADHVEAYAVDDHLLHGPLLSRSCGRPVYAPLGSRPAGRLSAERRSRTARAPCPAAAADRRTAPIARGLRPGPGSARTQQKGPPPRASAVGDPGLEPGTSSLSEKRSNRLS